MSGTDGALAEVTGAEWERRKEFFSFTEEDALLLQEMRPIAEALVEDVVAALYAHFLRFEETRVFYPDEATLAHVKRTQTAYFLALTAGEYGEQYLAGRLKIGRVHERIGLSPCWYMGAYSIYQQLITPRILQAFEGDVAKGQRTLQALLKLIALDQELAITTYIVARERTIARQLKELEARDRLVQLQMSGSSFALAYEAILQALEEVLQVDQIILYRPAATADELEAVAAWGLSRPGAMAQAETLAGLPAVPVGEESLPAGAFRLRQPRNGEAGEAAVPLLYRGQARGVLWVKGLDQDNREEMANTLWRLGQEAALVLWSAQVTEDLEAETVTADDLLKSDWSQDHGQA